MKKILKPFIYIAVSTMTFIFGFFNRDSEDGFGQVGRTAHADLPIIVTDTDGDGGGDGGWG